MSSQYVTGRLIQLESAQNGRRKTSSEQSDKLGLYPVHILKLARRASSLCAWCVMDKRLSSQLNELTRRSSFMA